MEESELRKGIVEAENETAIFIFYFFLLFCQTKRNTLSVWLSLDNQKIERKRTEKKEKNFMKISTR